MLDIMKKRLIIFAWALCLITIAYGQKKEVHILSANDMHAAIDQFPKLAAVADSLRTLYPSLLIFSAGDNRTGNPYNDLYEIPAYPMVVLMNIVGFHATTLGNHEFDSKAEGLARLINMSDFTYLCANIQADPAIGLHTFPSKMFDADGVKVGVVGSVQLGTHGLPDTHPDNVKGISFAPVMETLAGYEWMSQQADVTILLSHNGYDDEVKMAQAFPWADIIIGGHSHTQLDGGEMHNGVLVTQNANKLGKVTHITVVLENGKIVEKKAENIDLTKCTTKNPVVEEMVRYFNNNEAFKRVLAQVTTPFETYEELGCMICDAFCAEAGADVAIENFGGVRYETHPVGDFTVNDVLKLDPFRNDAVMLELTGEELRQMLIACHDNDGNNFPYVGGIKCEIHYDKADTKKIQKLQLFSLDGKKLNLKKKYKVVTNSYVAAISSSPRKDQGHSLNRETTDLIMKFLEHQGSVSYQGVRRLKFIR